MKVFLENYNGVLDLVEDHLAERGELTDNPHEADCFVLWQDVRGTCLELVRIAKLMDKPVVVMQHGRGCTRDYGPPNNFNLLADYIMVWGESEKQRLLNYGISQNRILVVGCPMFPRLKIPKPERRGKNILFVPVISQKEEPENILVYAALKIWESGNLIKTVGEHFNEMKRAWAWQNDEFREAKLPDGTTERRLWRRDVKNILPRWLTYERGLVNVKLSGVHDMYQYQAPVLTSAQNDPNHIDGIIDLLINVDVMVCLEEGTMQLLAHALDIPVIVVDIFRYENYGGCQNYDEVEKIHTNACYWTNKITKIGSLLDHALQHPLELTKCRAEVCRQDGGSNMGDSCANVIQVINTVLERSKRRLVRA